MNSNRTCVLEPESVNEDQSLWTTAQAALVLNRSERSVRRLVQQGTIAGHKVKGKFGEEWRIIPFTTESLRMKTIDQDENDEFSRECAENPDANNDSIFHQSSFNEASHHSAHSGVQKQFRPMHPTHMTSATTRSSLWKTIINLFQMLFSWNTRQDKMTSQTFKTQN
ncbi:MAG: helix-turn-helix domain-containing protein [Candidatus Obscuribacterales bacterium]